MMTHNTITCPLCLKCILPASDAGRYWSFLDQQVRRQLLELLNAPGMRSVCATYYCACPWFWFAASLHEHALPASDAGRYWSSLYQQVRLRYSVNCLFSLTRKFLRHAYYMS
jgi:hypothetical protein